MDLLELGSKVSNGSDYRYGYQGSEKDDELKGEGNSLDFGARIYDPRVGRWLSRDAMAADAPGWTPYRSFFDNPILFNDPDGNFEIPEALAAAHPNLKPMLDNIINELQKPENVDKLNAILKYGEFKDVNQLISLFSDSDKSVKLTSGDLLFVTDGKLDGDNANMILVNEIDKKSGLRKGVITIDDNLLRLIDGSEDLSGDAIDFVNKLFESTVLHEITHFGDDQDGKKNSSAPLRFWTKENGGLGTNVFTKDTDIPSEIGKIVEGKIYGGDVSAGQNKEVEQNIIEHETE